MSPHARLRVWLKTAADSSNRGLKKTVECSACYGPNQTTLGVGWLGDCPSQLAVRAIMIAVKLHMYLVNWGEKVDRSRLCHVDSSFLNLVVAVEYACRLQLDVHQIGIIDKEKIASQILEEYKKKATHYELEDCYPHALLCKEE